MNGFEQPARHPSSRELRSMVALAFKRATIATLSRHVYTFNGKTLIQGKGGSIGSELTGELARLYMLLWDKKYLEKLKSLGIRVIMYKRYVDDVVIVTEKVKEGYRFDGKSMVKAEDVPEGWNVSYPEHSDNKHTLDVLADIANTLDNDIVMEPDVGENHDNDKLPVLDLAMWMEEEGKGPQIRFTFYRKPMASEYLITQRSAMPNKTKRETILQEGLRIMRNCDQSTSRMERQNELTKFANRMRVSGYNERFRHDMVKGVIERWDRVEQEVREGERVMYRNRKEIKDHKVQSGGRSSSTWFMKGGVSGTVSVPITKNSALKESLTREISSLKGPDDGTTKVIERGGENITAGLSNMNPNRLPGCTFSSSECIVKEGQVCSTQSACYAISCTDCEAPVLTPDSQVPEGRKGRWVAGRRMRAATHTHQYYGQTGRSAHCRMREHLSALRRCDTKSPLYKHDVTQHSGVPREGRYEAEILSRHKHNLGRLVSEGNLILEATNCLGQDKVMNSKSEWGRGKLIRLTVVTDSY